MDTTLTPAPRHRSRSSSASAGRVSAQTVAGNDTAATMHNAVRKEITAIALTVFFALAISAPVFAADVPAGDFCDPKKMEECKSKLNTLLKSIDSLRAKVLKSKLELQSGRKLTDAEAEQMLKNMDSVYKTLPTPTTEGFMWDN